MLVDCRQMEVWITKSIGGGGVFADPTVGVGSCHVRQICCLRALAPLEPSRGAGGGWAARATEARKQKLLPATETRF